ncbi:hypothetical protein GCM10010360_46280 [Streptomyces nogalater]
MPDGDVPGMVITFGTGRLTTGVTSGSPGNLTVVCRAGGRAVGTGELVPWTESGGDEVIGAGPSVLTVSLGGLLMAGRREGSLGGWAGQAVPDPY